MSWGSRFKLYDEAAKHNEKLTGLVFDIQRFAVHDGPGIRTLVFLKGCPLKCSWCQNPESVCSRPEIMHVLKNCIGCGLCEQTCPMGCITKPVDQVHIINRDACSLPECSECQKVCYANAINISGRYLTISEVLEEVERDREFYQRTGGGVTFSGGEPLAQPVFLEALSREAKASNLHTAIETCGHAKWDTIKLVFKNIDLVLFDLKHMNSDRHRDLTGVSNELILENLKRIDSLGIPIRIRLPLVPGINDSAANIMATAAFVSGLTNLEALDLLPYHRIGESKWTQLDRAYELHGLSPHNREQIYDLVDIAKKYGFNVNVGG